MNIGASSLRCQGSRPPGSLPLVAIARLTTGAPRMKPFENGCRALRKEFDRGILWERRHREFLLAIDTQAGPARDQNLEG